MEIFPPKKVKVVNIKDKGRGVLAVKNIKAGEVVEVCPIIFLSDKEVDFLRKDSDVLRFYYLEQYAIKRFCLMLGYGSLYNHSQNPNADIEYSEDNLEDFVSVKAIKDIKAGEEIVFDYEFDNNIEDFLSLK